MGLDIKAVGQIGSKVSDEYIEDPGLIYLFPWECSSGCLAQHDGLGEGMYEYRPEIFYKRIGSYSYYNAFRQDLALFRFGKEPQHIWDNIEGFEGQPFVELINFADDEGFIGPKTSAKLFRDFLRHNADFAERCRAHFSIVGKPRKSLNFIVTYAKFLEAFRTAADFGVVKFL